MSAAEVDANVSEIPARIAELGQRVLDGGQVTREEALELFALEDSADIHTLLSWGNRIREHFKGNKIHLCSIVNAKAGACSENCSFCSQSAAYQTGSPRYGFVDPEPVAEAGEEANRNGVTAVGLVAAWRGLKEGPMLDEVCDRIREMKEQGQTRPDASLGLIESQEVADRLKEAGLESAEKDIHVSDLFGATECFVTSATREVMPCASLGLPSGQTLRFAEGGGEWTRLTMKTFSAYIDRYIQAHQADAIV